MKLSKDAAHALRARAIREHKVHLVGTPKLDMQRNVVFLDVEGIPDRDTYYLVGLRIKNDSGCRSHTFWADTLAEEKTMWDDCLLTLMSIEHPQLVFYGTYEITFLNRMKKRYCSTPEQRYHVDRLLDESINILSVITSGVYFPTFSNSLKDIAHHLGFQWSHSDSTGLSALAWRAEWEYSHNANIKQLLLTYNSEDCEAVELLTLTIYSFYQGLKESEHSERTDIVRADLIPSDNTVRFQVNSFVLPEFDFVNQAAYWDYQRDQIRLHSSSESRLATTKKIRSRAKILPPNEVIDCPSPEYCPRCNSVHIVRLNRRYKTIYDLKFSSAGIERWVIKYTFYRYRCLECNDFFNLKPGLDIEGRYSQNLLAYVIYQMIDLHISQIAIAEALFTIFGYKVERTTIHRQKALMANRYLVTYKRILERIVSGKLVHADETKVTIDGQIEYVWVITDLENVFYFHTSARSGDKLHELLHDFKGVLVSDFYATYDSFKCPQQKCLIHLIRDMNDDMKKAPFDNQLRGLIYEFAQILKLIIETVDQFGLKKDFLQKHKTEAESFFENLLHKTYTSDMATKYQKKFAKYHNKLFTFLDHNNIPWNNNNAEHAVKAFHRLRRVFQATSSQLGIDDYLILLSVYKTCDYKRVNFLDFLRSKEQDIDKYTQKYD